MSDYIKIFEDDNFFLRDDVASGITIDDEERRYSLFYKPNYHRVVVFCCDQEFALSELQANYQKYLTEAQEYD